MNLQQIKLAFAKHRIEKVKLGGFDVDGVLRGKYISLEKFFSAGGLRDLAVAMEIGVQRLTTSQAATALIERIRKLLKEVEIPDRLSAFGITRQMIPALAKKAMEDDCRLSNPRPCTEADLIALYEQAL